ncbi:hypothetical protein [Falsiroseomonas sp. E2-1-a4]|uniref:hypothetical protein n=1 Tax=Falsiroseomonas sp. E2-1-a4 TaxID=3239299 RepID=UPI003F2DF712
MLVDRVDIGVGGADVRLKLEGLASLARDLGRATRRSAQGGSMTGAAQMLTVRVPLAVRKQRGGRKLVLTPGGMASRGVSAADITLVKTLARAFRWRRMMEAGRYGTIDELAAAEKINSSYVSRLLRLTLLSPDIVEAILDGRQSDEMTLPRLMEPFPVEWEAQREPLPVG